MSNIVLEDYEPSDWDYTVSGIANAKNSGLTIDDLYVMLFHVKNGKELDIAISTQIDLKELVNA